MFQRDVIINYWEKKTSFWDFFLSPTEFLKEVLNIFTFDFPMQYSAAVTHSFSKIEKTIGLFEFSADCILIQLIIINSYRCKKYLARIFSQKNIVINKM